MSRYFNISLLFFFILFGIHTMEAQIVNGNEIDETMMRDILLEYPFQSQKQKDARDSLTAILYEYIKDSTSSEILKKNANLAVGHMHTQTSVFGNLHKGKSTGPDTLSLEVIRLSDELVAWQDSISKILCQLKNVIENKKNTRATRKYALENFLSHPIPATMKYGIKFRDSLRFEPFKKYDSYAELYEETRNSSINVIQNYYRFAIQNTKFYHSIDTLSRDWSKQNNIPCSYFDYYKGSPMSNGKNETERKLFGNNWTYFPFIMEHFDEYDKLTMGEFFLSIGRYSRDGYKKPWLLFDFIYANIDQKDSDFGYQLLDWSKWEKARFDKNNTKTKNNE